MLKILKFRLVISQEPNNVVVILIAQSKLIFSNKYYDTLIFSSKS